MRIKNENRNELMQACLGVVENDIVIKNVNIVNVFTGEVLFGHIGVHKGFISHVEYTKGCTIRAKKEYDYSGHYAIPGLIDSHVHIESSMMTPKNFCATVLPHGTTTVITDPHEIANVMGVEGVKYMAECGQDLPMRQYILAPSCVPAVLEVEQAGACLGQKEVADILKLDNVLGIAEVMDFMGVVTGEPRMKEILDLGFCQDVYIQGHAPLLSGSSLSAYLCGGPTSDHECSTHEETIEKIRYGMHIDAREASTVHDIKTIVEACKDLKYKDFLTICTDDRESGDLLHEGSVNHVLNCAIKAGLDPVDAIKCSTINSARGIGITNLGAIAPGYTADIVICDSINEVKPKAVFAKGKLAAENGKLTAALPEKSYAAEEVNTIKIPEISIADLKIKAPVESGKAIANVIACENNSLCKQQEETEVDITQGYADISNQPNLRYVAVINRHGYNNISLGIVKNSGLKEGAFACTVSHDSHNITVVYDKPENAITCINEIKRLKGGLACAANEKITASLQLEIAGLMTKTPCDELAEKVNVIKQTLKNQGIAEAANPILKVAMLALPVIPKFVITDKGLVDVLTKQFVPLFK